MTDDIWLQAATADDALVAQLLVNLHHSSPPPPPPLPPPSFPMKWSVRQPRSRPLTVKTGLSRASPTTPLSWSGAATSQSGGAGAGAARAAVGSSEESSRQGPGSKVAGTNEVTNDAAPLKRSRKKKNLTELKEEELLMLQQKKDLKRTLAAILGNLEKQKAANISLKRIKMDFEMQPTAEAAPSILPPRVTEKYSVTSQNRCVQVQKDVIGRECKFVLPDLNVTFEEFCAEGPNEMGQR